MSRNKKKPVPLIKQKPLPSTGEGAGSALEAMRKQLQQKPVADVPPITPAKT